MTAIAGGGARVGGGHFPTSLRRRFPAPTVSVQPHCSTGAPMSGYLSEYKSPLNGHDG